MKNEMNQTNTRHGTNTKDVVDVLEQRGMKIDHLSFTHYQSTSRTTSNETHRIENLKKPHITKSGNLMTCVVGYDNIKDVLATSAKLGYQIEGCEFYKESGGLWLDFAKGDLSHLEPITEEFIDFVLSRLSRVNFE